jgi:probable F420-dependent oxidoreductase
MSSDFRAVIGRITMKFGIRYCNTGRYTDPAQAIELVQAAEAAGFESAWTVEHTIIPRSYESPYPYTQDGKIPGVREDTSLPDPQIWLAYVAARTTKINLATGILILPQHNPVICAKQVATLDHMSGGRVILGIGVGWLKEEFDALGVPFEERGARTDDYIRALRTLWAEDVATYQGKYVSFHDVYMRPKPVRREVPIIIGGDSKPAASRAGRLGNGYFPGRGASLELIDLVRRSAVKAGRDPALIEITASMPDDPATLSDLAVAGISRVPGSCINGRAETAGKWPGRPGEMARHY